MCMLQLDHITMITFSNASLCCSSNQTNRCKKKKKGSLFCRHYCLGPASCLNIEKEETILVSRSLILNLCISVIGGLWEDFPEQEIVKDPQSFSQFSVEKIMHSLRGLSDKFPPTLGPMIQ